jgi:hypothetical protein
VRVAQVDPQRRAEALRIAAEEGAAAAARQTGVPAATIRSWRRRDGQAGPPAGVDPAAWAELKETAARDTWEAAQSALTKVNELLAAGKTADAQKAALTMAIALDKSLLLEAAAAAATERRARITQEAADAMVQVMQTFFGAVGLPWQIGGPLAKLLAELMRQTQGGGPLKPSTATVEAARAEINESAAGLLALAPWYAKDPAHLSPATRRVIADALAAEAEKAAEAV